MKKTKLLTSLSSLTAVAVVTPILATGCDDKDNETPITKLNVVCNILPYISSNDKTDVQYLTLNTFYENNEVEISSVEITSSDAKVIQGVWNPMTPNMITFTFPEIRTAWVSDITFNIKVIDKQGHVGFITTQPCTVIPEQLATFDHYEFSTAVDQVHLNQTITTSVLGHAWINGAYLNTIEIFYLKTMTEDKTIATSTVNAKNQLIVEGKGLGQTKLDLIAMGSITYEQKKIYVTGSYSATIKVIQ